MGRYSEKIVEKSHTPCALERKHGAFSALTGSPPLEPGTKLDAALPMRDSPWHADRHTSMPCRSGFTEAAAAVKLGGVRHPMHAALAVCSLALAIDKSSGCVAVVPALALAIRQDPGAMGGSTVTRRRGRRPLG